MRKIIRIFRKIFTSINPVLANKIMYKKIMKTQLQLDNPKSFNEKINYLKIYNYPNNNMVIKCADKYMVRDYIVEKGLGKYLTKLIGSWDNVDDINFETLPNKFVLKCNHGCGYNIICKNKGDLNIKKIKRQLKKWMREDFGNVSGEKHYSKIKPKIICEEYLGENIKDYKFFCFKGKPEFFYVSQNVNGDFHNMQADFFYCDGSPTEFFRTDHSGFKKTPSIPKNLKELVKVASILSKDFEFVRVDLFDIDNKIYFSELTFTPCSGFMPISPKKYDYKYGNMIDLERFK